MDEVEEVSALPATVGITVGEFQVGVELYVDEDEEDEEWEEVDVFVSVSLEVEKRSKSDCVAVVL